MDADVTHQYQLQPSWDPTWVDLSEEQYLLLQADPQKAQRYKFRRRPVGEWEEL